MRLVPVALSAAGDRGLLRGVLQRHPLAALPRRRRQAGVPPGVVGRLRHGQPALRREGRRPRRRERAWSGSTTTSSSWCRRCCASCGPTCASASSCTSRSRPRELFVQLPWRRQILEGLLGADLVGFQRPGGAQNFVRLVRQRVGHKTHRDLVYLPDGRMVEAAAFPISIDFDGLAELSRSEGVEARAKEIREQLGNPRHVLLGVDRLDYTKGIYKRLRAFGELLADGAARRRGRGLRPGGDPVAGAGRRVPPAPRRDRPPGRPDQRRLRPHRPAGDLLPARVVSRARRWPRCTGPPTSWSSRRCATG